VELSRADILYFLQEPSNEVFKIADKIRKENVGDTVHLRGLIEFSNYCTKNCLYCGIRSANKEVERYRLSEEEILKYSKGAVELGLKTLVLQSGEDNYYNVDKMVSIIRGIKKHDVVLTLSIGEKSAEEYKAYKDAGADRFLMRIETTDKELYKKMHPNSNYEKRVEALKEIKRLGFETGTGCLVGLPGQTIESLADDILFFREIGADMVGIGPFISNSQTPLKDSPNGNFELALKVMALTRIVLPKANIPATTAMETIHPNGRILALKCGANVVMPNMTDYDINKNYELYKNKVSNNKGIDETLKDIKDKIISLNRTPL